MREWAAIERASFADIEAQPEADIWPRRHGYVVTGDVGTRRVESMIWGVPLKANGKRPGSTITKHITNVRNLQSQFWRSMLAVPSQRCLVPFSQFAEPKPNAGRDEVWFAVKGKSISAFAGIWRETENGPVYAFLTCEPNPLVKPIHSKAMPVILQPDQYEGWLSGEAAESFQEPFPSQLMAIP